MTDPLAPLSTDIDDFCFFDTETRAAPDLADPRWGNVKFAGTHRYSRSSKVIILTYAIGLGPVKAWVQEDFGKSLRWSDAPADLREFLTRAQQGEAWFVAWNAAFDREVTNYSIAALTRKPSLPVEAVIDASPQAMASGLPAGLGHAASVLKTRRKVDAGKHLIGIFCAANGGTPQTHPKEWQEFIHYACEDVEAMRDIFRSTRQLSRRDWEEYWAAEHINMRGVPIDRAYVERASALADVYASRAAADVRRITGNDWGPKHHVALANWTFDRLEPTQPELCDVMATTYEEGDSEDDWVIGKVSLDRERIERIILVLEALDAEQGLTDDELAALELCEVKLYGAGSTVLKFDKMLPMLSEDDRLRCQYVFNGAAQTGRFSSRGVQLHNLTRQWVGMEDGDTGAEERALVFIAELDL